MRYMVVYGKDLPFAFWASTKEEAVNMAVRLRNVGYDVSIWEHGNGGSRKTIL